MMKQCEQCAYYFKSWDDLCARVDDCVVIGEEEKEKHYCTMYDMQAIDDDIVSDKVQCENFLPISSVEEDWKKLNEIRDKSMVTF